MSEEEKVLKKLESDIEVILELIAKQKKEIDRQNKLIDLHDMWEARDLINENRQLIKEKENLIEENRQLAVIINKLKDNGNHIPRID